jgi:hypothetical protein
MSDNRYFAAQEPFKVAGALLNRANQWFHQLDTTGYLWKIRESWKFYHGAYYGGDGHKILFGGEQGEIAHLPVNHYRNIAQHILTMVTANRPALTARATNTDAKSVYQTKLANGLLDYYMREKRLEKYFKTAVEYAIVLGAGYIKTDWNGTTGEVYDFNEETNSPIYEGDIEYKNLSPFDVMFDSTKEGNDHDWVICRTYKNKFDLAAKYPEFKDKIEGLPTKSDLYRYRFDMMFYSETDDVPVYEFYHKRTESMPDGRYMLFLIEDLVLEDRPMPYRNLPVYRIVPSEVLGTPYGYSSMFDLMPIQDAINSLNSAILTNQNAFAIQNIYVPKGADIVISNLAGGLNIIEGNPAAGKPEPLNLTQTPGEIFNYLKMLEGMMETISGINSVARGSPEANLRSANALALVQSLALQFISGLQQSYVQMIEDVGTGTINMLKDFAAVPRIAAIVGESNETILKSFTGDDLNLVNRVIVDLGNALAQTKAGRIEMATNLIQYGLIDNPKQYLSVLNTGNLDVMTDPAEKELNLIRRENEKLIEGGDVIAIDTDSHLMHIKEHKTVLADPDLRLDTELVGRVLGHINEHLAALRESDPGLLSALGEQPLPPVNPPMPPGGAPGDMSGLIAGPETAAVSPEQYGAQPSIPTPPPPFEQLPVTADQMAPEIPKGQ